MHDDPKDEKPEAATLPWVPDSIWQLLPPNAARASAAGTSSASFVGAWTAPLPDDHEFYKNVGRVASEWSHIEHVLDLTIWRLSGLEGKIAACMTSQIVGVAPRCKAIMNMAKLHGLTHEELKPYRSLMGDASVVAELRHRVVHDAWYADMPAATPMQFRAMPYSDPRHGYQEIAQSEINDTIEKIKVLQERAYQYHNDLFAKLEALQESNG
jgi:hypothetical protein